MLLSLEEKDKDEKEIIFNCHEAMEFKDFKDRIRKTQFFERRMYKKLGFKSNQFNIISFDSCLICSYTDRNIY